MVLGGAAAWWMHRRTRLSPWNVYVAWLMCVGVSPAVIAGHRLAALGVTLVLLAGATTASVVARRWRVSALGAGGELREHERARILVWTALRAGHERRARVEGAAAERLYIAGQGDLLRQGGWPPAVSGLPMTADGRATLPLGEGHHLLFGVWPQAPPRKPRGRQGPWTSGRDYCSIPQPPGRSMPFVMSTVPPRGR